MYKLIFVFLSALPLIGIAHAEIAHDAVSVNPYTLPGDSERNMLGLPGIRLHEANDWIGSTDKHVTESAGLNAMYNWEHLSTAISYKGRYLTPALRPSNSRAKYDSPIGIYAEWAETAIHQSITLFSEKTWAIKLDGSLSYNDFGDHSFTDIYREVHRATNDPDETDKFGEKLDAHFIGNSYGASLVIPMGQVNLITGYQVMNSRLFREEALEAALLVSVSEDLAFSAKYTYVTQKRSDFYDLKDFRHQYVAGLRLFKFWTPSIMYVSAYIKGDSVGQWYASPVSFTYVF